MIEYIVCKFRPLSNPQAIQSFNDATRMPSRTSKTAFQNSFPLNPTSEILNLGVSDILPCVHQRDEERSQDIVTPMPIPRSPVKLPSPQIQKLVSTHTARNTSSDRDDYEERPAQKSSVSEIAAVDVVPLALYLEQQRRLDELQKQVEYLLSVSTIELNKEMFNQMEVKEIEESNISEQSFKVGSLTLQSQLCDIDVVPPVEIVSTLIDEEKASVMQSAHRSGAVLEPPSLLDVQYFKSMFKSDTAIQNGIFTLFYCLTRSDTLILENRKWRKREIGEAKRWRGHVVIQPFGVADTYAISDKDLNRIPPDRRLRGQLE